MPLATGLDATSSMPSTSRAAQVPTTSMMASMPPTSWKWTCSGGRRCRWPSARAKAWNVARARRRTRSGRRASSTSAVDVGRGAHDGRLLGVHVDLGAADAGAHDRLGLELPPADRQALAQLAHLVEVGAGVDERAQGHVAGDPGEAVEPGDASRHSSRSASSRVRQQANDGAGRAEAVVDADDGDPDRARRQHGQQRGDAFERRAVADAGRHGDDRRRGEAADHAGQRAFHAGDHDDRVGRRELVGGVEHAVQAGHADVGDAQRAEAVGVQHGRALVGDRQVGGARGDHDDLLVARSAPAATRRSVRPVAGDGGVGIDGQRPHRAWSGSARVSSTGAEPGWASSSATIAAHCSGVLPGP